MKAFDFGHRFVEAYARVSRSFSTIRADDLKSETDRQYDEGRFWPDALLSINPRFLRGPARQCRAGGAAHDLNQEEICNLQGRD